MRDRSCPDFLCRSPLRCPRCGILLRYTVQIGDVCEDCDFERHFGHMQIGDAVEFGALQNGDLSCLGIDRAEEIHYTGKGRHTPRGQYRARIAASA